MGALSPGPHSTGMRKAAARGRPTSTPADLRAARPRRGGCSWWSGSEGAAAVRGHRGGWHIVPTNGLIRLWTTDSHRVRKQDAHGVVAPQPEEATSAQADRGAHCAHGPARAGGWGLCPPRGRGCVPLRGQGCVPPRGWGLRSGGCVPPRGWGCPTSVTSPGAPATALEPTQDGPALAAWGPARRPSPLGGSALCLRVNGKSGSGALR